MRRLRRLLCRLFGHRAVSVPLGGCPGAPLGLWAVVWATCCERCRRELPGTRDCDLHGTECPTNKVTP